VKLTFSLDLDKIIEKHYPDTIKPPLPRDLELYLDYNRVNSERLKVVKKRSKSISLEELEGMRENQEQQERDEITSSSALRPDRDLCESLEESEKMLNK
jgi:phosphomevalonate kinase